MQTEIAAPVAAQDFDRLLSPADVRKILGCSESKIRQLIRDRKIAFFKLGRRIIIRTSALNTFLSELEDKEAA